MVETASFFGEVVLGIVEAFGVGGDAVAERGEGDAHVLFGAGFAIEPISVVTGVVFEEVLEFETEFFGEADEVFMIGVDEFGAEFDELVVGVEVFAGEDATAAALGGFEEVDGSAFLGEAVGGGEAGDTGADDGDGGIIGELAGGNATGGSGAGGGGGELLDEATAGLGAVGAGLRQGAEDETEKGSTTGHGRETRWNAR